MTHDHLLSPYRIGSMELKNRVMLPPHGHVISPLWGSEDEAAAHVGYWRARTDAAWVDGVSAHVRNPLVPGFEPTGVGAQIHGHFRQPYFLDRVGHLADVLHSDDTRLTVQMILQGGMPHGASPRPSGPVVTQVPHALTVDEIDWFVEEYRHGARQVALAGADGVELHLNHDDLMEYFLSPITNHRDDEYGGSPVNRLRFPLRVLRALREELGADRVVGVRLTMAEAEPGGYDLTGGIEIARALEQSGAVDYLSLAMGSPWGNPSYIQSHHHRPAEWAPMAGRFRAATGLPIAYTGRVSGPDVAEEVLAAGHADIVGMARAWIADAGLLAKVRAGRAGDVRPCVGGNECISRRLLEGVPFSCAVNPVAGREEQPIPTPTARRRVLVVGGGPAGMEVAGRAAEQGHAVRLWEAQDHLGGQLAVAARAPRYDDYGSYLAWQERRLGTAGVDVRLGRHATADDVAAADADVVVVATGGRPRRPDLPGSDLPHVHLAADVLATPPSDLGHHVLVAAHDEHLPPYAVADFLAERGHAVTLLHGTAGPAPLVSRYLVGSVLGRLDASGVRLRGSESVVAITESTITVRHVYSEVLRELTDVDAVVLAYGATPENQLHVDLHDRGVEAHILGDAYAPRRLVFALRQAHDLAVSL